MGAAADNDTYMYIYCIIKCTIYTTLFVPTCWTAYILLYYGGSSPLLGVYACTAAVYKQHKTCTRYVHRPSASIAHNARALYCITSDIHS